MSARKPKRHAEADARARAKASARASADETADDLASEVPSEPDWGKLAYATLLGVTVAMLAVRLYAASNIGFGDSEALYATWAAHPQPAYLDHPGLIGVVARVIGEGAIPTPLRAHAVTSLVATLFPWLVFGSARALGAARGRAALAALIVAVIPETAVGLYALTPDLLLAPAWVGVLALAGVGLRAEPRGTRSAAAFLGAGLLAGIASSAKVSGLLLLVALAATYVSLARGKALESRGGARARTASRTLWPWAGLAAGLVVVLPIASYEAKTGWPMLHHRFVDTQHGAGLALKNLGALFGGQLLYLSPVFAVLAVLAARDLIRHRNDDAVSRLLFWSFAIPIVPLIGLCLWSPVAEPHWIAPALLALVLHAARRTAPPAIASRKVVTIATAIAALLTVATHAWVLTPDSAKLLPASVDPKLDISNELYGWPMALRAVREHIGSTSTPFDTSGQETVVVGPNWMICAQLAAGLPGVRVGCATPVKDDFDGWLPRAEWKKAEHVVFVTDNRFPGDGAELFPEHVRTSQSRLSEIRGGRTARVFELYMYDRRAQGSR